MKLKKIFQSALRSSHPESVVSRRALSAAIAVFVAVIADRYISMRHEFWVGLTTVLVLQMTIRATFQREMSRFLVVICSIFFCSLIYLGLQQSFARDLFVVCVFIIGCFIHEVYAANRTGFSAPLMVAYIALTMLVPFASEGHVIFARIHDVLFGGIIAIIASMLIFPGRPDVDFRAEVIPVLQGYDEYLSAIVALLFRKNDAEKNAEEKKAAIEAFLQTRRAFFPDWVYETGFNPNLRQGHRHFLLRVEQVGEVLFAMHHAARYTIDAALLDKLRAPVMRCVTDSRKLIDNLISVLTEAKLKSMDSSLPDDIQGLDAAFHEAIPLPFELLDMSPDYIHLAGFVYDLNDLQKVLFVLAESLRAYIFVPQHEA